MRKRPNAPHADPGKLSDEELIALTAKRRWESRLPELGCGTGCIVGLAVIIVSTIKLGFDAIPITVALGILVAGTSYRICDGVANFRTRGYLQEAHRRFGPRDMTTSIRQAKRHMAGEDGPDWILLLRGHALPHGGTQDIDVALWVSEPGATIETRTRSSKSDPKSGAVHGARKSGKLAPDDQSAILALAEQLLKPQSKSIPCVVVDGYPCQLAVLRRTPRRVVLVECNLAGLPDEYAGHPIPTLMTRLLETRRSLGEDQALYGACDASGNIVIGEV